MLIQTGGGVGPKRCRSYEAMSVRPVATRLARFASRHWSPKLSSMSMTIKLSDMVSRRGDPMPIHLDLNRQGCISSRIIVHGLCTQAFTSWAVPTQDGDSDVSRSKRLPVQFASPVLPARDLETYIPKTRSAGSTTTYVFEPTGGGVAVIKDGYAEIAR